VWSERPRRIPAANAREPLRFRIDASVSAALPATSGRSVEPTQAHRENTSVHVPNAAIAIATRPTRRLRTSRPRKYIAGSASVPPVAESARIPMSPRPKIRNSNSVALR
jgi:hypothetical protein